MVPRPIGLIVNPRSGNDVRRVIASAGSSTLEDKASIVRRVVLGARVLGATSFITHHEPHHVVRRATETMRGITVEKIGEPIDNTEHDTTRAVAIMRERGCAVVVVETLSPFLSPDDPRPYLVLADAAAAVVLGPARAGPRTAPLGC
jgi:predicted polyphosphate/ATP-dependent NAD kinase